MKLSELINSKEYRDARAKVDVWRGRLATGDKSDTARVRDEKVAFFGAMRKTRPDLYAAFQIDDKTLSEAIIKNLTGRDVIID